MQLFQSYSGVKTVIGGSYRKSLAEMFVLKEFLRQQGIEVLSPVGHAPRNEGEEFILLDADPISDARTLQDSIFAKMRTAAFHVVVNPNSYIGPAAMLEIGYAIALGIQIFTTEPVKDAHLAVYCRDLKELFPDWKITIDENMEQNQVFPQ